MNEWSSRVADELVGCYCLPTLTFSIADSSIHTYRPIRLGYAFQSRLWCWIVDFVFRFSSSEPFVLGYIDINFLYASPVCRLCVCERQRLHQYVRTDVFIAAATVDWSIVCFTVRRMCARVKIATSHASTVSTPQQKHKSVPLRPCYVTFGDQHFSLAGWRPKTLFLVNSVYTNNVVYTRVHV